MQIHAMRPKLRAAHQAAQKADAKLFAILADHDPDFPSIDLGRMNIAAEKFEEAARLLRDLAAIATHDDQVKKY